MRNFFAKSSIWIVPWAYVFGALFIGFTSALVLSGGVPQETQTLVAGTLGFLGAAIIAIVNSQNRYRKTRAVRALLPQALSELLHYYGDQLSSLATLYSEFELMSRQDRQQFSVNIVQPTLPDKHLETIQSCIEFAPIETSEALIDILSRLQVFIARMHGITSNGEGRHKYYVGDVCIYSADLFARTEQLFSYARFEVEIVKNDKPYRERIKTLLQRHDLYPDMNRDLYLVIDRRYPEES
jgi:hypothetical protein